MLLIALTGPIGSGKSTTLEALAGWASSEGLRTEGFVQRALGVRGRRRQGAPGYALVHLATGDALPFAEREFDEAGRGRGYRFHAPALAEAHQRVAEALTSTPPDLLLLDEFGREEAAGGGHVGLWPQVAEAAPGTVVLAVRQGWIPQVEAALGRRFDRVLTLPPGEGPARDEALQELRALVLEERDWARVGLYGAGSGGFEWSVGSALHAIRLPLRGLALSSTQAAVMVFAGAGLGRRSRVVWVPFIAAGIKALSPAGSRVRVMMAITIQGLLFGGGTRLLGWNPLGIVVGGALVGAWAAAQGLLLQYLLVGSDLLRAYETVISWVLQRWSVGMPGIALLLGGWVGSWALVSGTVSLVAWRKGVLPARLSDALDRGASGLRWEEPAPSAVSALGRGLRDILRPVFWIPVMIVVLILLSAGATWERAFWISARALTVGVVLFSLVRAFDPRGFVRWLRNRGHWGPAVAFERALRR
jgi:nucleoside-triphosphatase THEP1